MQLKNKAYAILCILMLALPLTSVAFIAPAKAVIGSASTPVSKVITGVNTRFYITGSGWTPSATFYYQWDTSDTWSTGTPAGFTADSNGNIPPGSHLDLTATSAETWYLLLSQSGDGSTGVVLVATVTAKSAGPSFKLSTTYGSPGSEIEVSGSSFEPGKTVSIYWDSSTVLATLSVASDGTISGSFIVPTVEGGSYTVWALQSDGFAAESSDNSGYSYVSFTVEPAISVDRLSIRGTVGETFVITGRGWKAGEDITSVSVAGQLEAFITTPTVGTDGTFTGTVRIDHAITAYGLADITLTGSSTGSKTFSGVIVISTPAVVGDEGFDLTPSSGCVGDSVTVTLYNWPAGASVSVSLGGTSWGTLTTDSNGAAKSDFTVPETYGGLYTVVANYAGLRKTASFTVNGKLEVFFADTGAKAYASSEPYPYVAKDTILKVVATGLSPSTEYTITDGTTNIVTGGYVVSVTKGTLGVDKVKSTIKGTIELTYYAVGSATTGTDVQVTVGGLSVMYNAIGDPSMSISPDHGATTAPVTVTVTVSNLVPGVYYQILLDGAPQIIDAGPENYFVPTGPAGGTASGSPTITIPANIAAGVHKISLTYFGSTTSLYDCYYIASTPGGTAAIQLSATAIHYGEAVIVYGYNFGSLETGVNVKVVGTTLTPVSASVADDGSFRATLITTTTKLAGGTYIVYADRTSGTEPTATLTVNPYLDAPDSGVIDGSISFSVYGLNPTTRYVLLLDSTTVISFQTDADGYQTGSFIVPAVLPGTYTLAVAPEDNPTATIISKSFTVENAFTLTPNPEAIAGQTVQFSWAVPGSPSLNPPIWVTVYIDGTPYVTLQASYSGGVLSGSFVMPNGEADAILEIKVYYSDSKMTAQAGVATATIKAIESLTITDAGGTDLDTIEGTITISDNLGTITVITVPSTTVEGATLPLTISVIGTNGFTGNVVITAYDPVNPGATEPDTSGSISYYVEGALGSMTIRAPSTGTHDESFTLEAAGSVTLAQSFDGEANNPEIDFVPSPQTGTSGTATIKRVSGAGSLLIGVDLASDIAYIKGTVSNIAVSLSELDAKVVAIKGTLATIDTRLGTMTAKLDAINATLVSISDGVATINSTLGEVKTSLEAIDLSALDAKLTSINGTLVTISTAIGDVQTTLDGINAKVVSIQGDVATIKTDVGTISGKVTSIDGNVATISTAVGDVKADISDIKDSLEDVPPAISGVTTAVWIAVILSLVAAIAAIAAVVTITRKIAG